MKRRAMTAALMAGVLTLAACGSDDEGSSDDEGTAAEETTAEATAAEETTAEGTAAEETTPEGTMAEETTAEGTMAEVTTPEGTMAPVTPGDDWPDSLTLTLTPSQETGGLIETAEPLAEMLSERLGGIEIEALVPTDYAGVIVALQSGQAHIAGGLGPRQMVQVEEQAEGDLILQAERFGSLTYVTQWFTNDPDTFCADEPVADDEGFLFCNGVLDAEEGPIGEDQLAKVEGKTVAFVEQGSTSGYAIPALQLNDAGIDPVGGVEALFAGGHDTAVQAVYDGDAAVGVSFNDARAELVETVPDVGEKVVVFGWSGPIPNDGVAVAGELPDDLKTAITDAFTDISQDEEGVALLQELYNIDALVPVTSSDYDVIRDLEAELGDVLG